MPSENLGKPLVVLRGLQSLVVAPVIINESLNLLGDDLCRISLSFGSASRGDGRLYLIYAIGSIIGIGTLRRRRNGIFGILASMFIT